MTEYEDALRKIEKAFSLSGGRTLKEGTGGGYLNLWEAAEELHLSDAIDTVLQNPTAEEDLKLLQAGAKFDHTQLPQHMQANITDILAGLRDKLES